MGTIDVQFNLARQKQGGLASFTILNRAGVFLYFVHAGEWSEI